METKKVLLSSIKVNEKNPRTITDENFKKLVKSIKDFPEMIQIRKIVVNKDMIILGGNMRYKAMVEAGITETMVDIVDWSEEKQKEFIIKDNLENGDWDFTTLANEWDKNLLNEWGFEYNWDENKKEEQNEQYNEQYQIVIECENEIEQKEHYDKLSSLGYKCKVLTI